MDKIKDLLFAIPENIYGLTVLLIAGGLAVYAHHSTTTDHDLWGFIGGLAMTGSAIMHAKKD